jgi:hypothetical protein
VSSLVLGAVVSTTAAKFRSSLCLDTLGERSASGRPKNVPIRLPRRCVKYTVTQSGSMMTRGRKLLK